MKTTSTPGLRSDNKKKHSQKSLKWATVKAIFWIIVGIAIDDSMKTIRAYQYLKKTVGDNTSKIVESAKEEFPVIQTTENITQEMWDRLSLTTGTNETTQVEPIGRVDKDFDVFLRHEVSADAINSVLHGTLEGKGEAFVGAGRKYGISPAFLAGIAFQESGGGTSSLAHSHNNVCGILIEGAAPRKFDSVEDCIEYTARQLKCSPHYFKSGKKTVREIQATYCPVGAKNDPKGLNKHWLGGVLRGMNIVLANERDLIASN